MATSPSWRSWRWINGGIRPFKGGLPLSDRGFRYGQHLFESIAIRGGAALLAAEHLAILTASAKIYGIPFPRSLVAKLRDFLKDVSLANGMLRLYLTAGPGAPASPITKPGLYLTWESAHFPTQRESEKGYDVVLLKKPFLGEGWGVKSGNYIPHIETLRSAREAGAQEAIVCDQEGRIISCAMGNLLLWIPGSRSENEPLLCTPSPAVGARPGAVLKWVQRQAPVVERELHVTDLLRASALAITNSRLGIMPVTTLDGRQLSDPAPARALAENYLYDLLGTP